MKYSAKAQEKLRQNQAAAPSGGLSLKRAAGLVLCLLLAAGGTVAVLEFVVWNKLPAELLGKWVVMEGPDEGGTIDFHRNGTMVAVVNLQGKKGIVNARIRVEGKQIHATLTNEITGELGTRVQVIRTLTEKSLVLADEQGNLLKMERAD